MDETLTKNGFAMPEPFFGAHQLGTELTEVRSTKVFEFASFEQIPHTFLWVQLGGIARQLLQMNAFGSPCGQEIFDHVTPMNRGSIPNDQQFAGNLAREHLQKAHDIWPFVRMVLHLHEDPSIHRQTSNDGKMITGQRNREDRRLADRRIGANGHGQEIKRRLVYTDDRPLFLCGLFFNAATRCSRQVWIACTSRWLARLSGFWTLCLMALSRRLQWVG